MPEYSKSDITFIVDKDRFERMFRNAESRRDKAWITVLWLSACRPQEALELTRNNITIDEERTKFHIVTKKLPYKKKGKFIIERRNLSLKIVKTNPYIKNLSKYLYFFKPEEMVFQFSDKTGENIVDRISMRAFDKHLCPYNLRHSRLTLLAEAGATIDELMRFKGARDKKSVREYLHSREVEYNVDVEM